MKYCVFISQTSIPAFIGIGVLIDVAVLNVGQLNWSKLKEVAF